MANQDVELLVAQMRTILLNQPLERDNRVKDPELAVLQDAMFYLADCLTESNEFLHHLQKGELDATAPGRHNFLAGSLKELHSALIHLTWQADQAAHGDYSQSVHFLGDFSTSFNQMIEQLAERESKLKIQSRILEESVERMKAVMDGLKDWILVTLQNTGEIVYANHSAKQFYDASSPEQKRCPDYQRLLEYIQRCGQMEDESRIYEYQYSQTRRTFRIRSYEIPWSEEMAWAHIITDVTKEWKYRERMEGLAYIDELTGLYNRRFCLERLEQMVKQGTEFTFCMMDVDGLKYANDTFGHGAGDEYLKTVAGELLQSSRSTDMICRIGGDEFAALFPQCKAQVILDKMERLDQTLAHQSQQFPMSVSYGVVYVEPGETTSVQELMEQADGRMYVLKNMKKAAQQEGGLMVSFAWSKDLETGHEEIDQEHKTLLQAVNRLMEACATGVGEKELGATLDVLIQHIKTHFDHEEQLQVEYGYPGYANHKQLHQGILRVVEALSNRIREEGSTPQIKMEINKHLTGWLFNHIKTEDMRVTQYIQRRMG